MRTLVLASTSRYRADLLRRLRVPFLTAVPEVDENACPIVAPAARARALALAKARAVAPRHPESLIIGCDQVASCGDMRLDKPGTEAAALEQLHLASGCDIELATAVCVLDAATGVAHEGLSPCKVGIRALGDVALRRYVALDRPIDCAGAFRSEGAGSAIISRIVAEDPTAVVGLPLILLVHLLSQSGYDVLEAASAQAQT